MRSRADYRGWGDRLVGRGAPRHLADPRPGSEPCEVRVNFALPKASILSGVTANTSTRPVASRVQKAVLAHFEPPASVPFHHPGLVEATERVVIGDLNRPALDHEPGTAYSASAGRMARGEPVIGTAGEPLAPRPRTSLAAPSRPRLIAARSPALSARCAGCREASRGLTVTIRRCLIVQRPAETSIADWRARCGGRPGLAD